MSAVVIRIYSGVHAGAQIELTPGTWVFGRDDSCDIILTDASIAARHAAFTAADNDLSFEKLDGVVAGPDGREIKGPKLAPGALWRMGSVLAAWGAADAEEPFWEGVARAVAELSRPAQNASAAGEHESAIGRSESQNGGTQAEGAAASDGHEGTSPEDEAQSAQNGAASETEDGGKPAERSGSAKWALIAVLLLLIVFFASLFLSPALRSRMLEFAKPAVDPAGWTSEHETDGSEGAGSSSSALRGWVVKQLGPEGVFERLGVKAADPQAAARELDQLRQTLAAKGFKEVSVHRAETGAWLFKGSVKNDHERAALLDFARGFESPVVLDVSVDSDYTDAVRTAFNSIDFWPEVTLEKSASGNGGEVKQKLVVSAYMLSNFVEEKAFGDAAEVVAMGGRGAEKLEVVRRIPSPARTLS